MKHFKEKFGAYAGENAKLRGELQRSGDAVAKARKALGQEETQWRQHGEGEVELPVIESLKSGKSNRAHDVVKELGENWKETAQPAAQQPPTEGQFNPKWFKGKGFSTPGGGRQGGMNGQGGFNGGQGGVNGMRGFGGGQGGQGMGGMGGMGGGAGFFNVEPEDNPFTTDSPAPASARRGVAAAAIGATGRAGQPRFQTPPARPALLLPHPAGTLPSRPRPPPTTSW